MIIAKFVDIVTPESFRLLASLVDQSQRGKVPREHFFSTLLYRFYDCMGGGLDDLLGHVIYRISDLLPPDERRGLYVYPNAKGPDHTLASWREEWEKKFDSDGIPFVTNIPPIIHSLMFNQAIEEAVQFCDKLALPSGTCLLWGNYDIPAVFQSSDIMDQSDVSYVALEKPNTEAYFFHAAIRIAPDYFKHTAVMFPNGWVLVTLYH